AAKTTTTWKSASAVTTTPPTTKAAVKAAPPTTAAPAPTTTRPAPPPPPPVDQSAAAFLACVRQRESGGNYQAVSANGLYMGAYQFHQDTWNYAAGSLAGRGDLVGLKPNTVAPADQDAVALALYKRSG